MPSAVKKILSIGALIAGAGLWNCAPIVVAELSWKELKGNHFVLYYEEASDEALANQVLNRAEDYYRKIDGQIGYSRYTETWTWEERVKIFIFKDQKSFQEYTGQPTWSHGLAHSGKEIFGSRVIITYRQNKEFLDGILPHEISHLILHDFVGNKIPLWFDEGVAQLQEADKMVKARAIMRSVVKKGKHIPFKVMNRWDIRSESDSQVVAVFYAQSACVVEFLIKNYGISVFQQICRGLREGKKFEDTLQSASAHSVNSLADLEKKWVMSMQ